VSDLRRVDARIAALKKGGISSGEEEAYAKLMSERQKFRDTLDDNDARYADAQSSKWDARVSAFEATTDKQLKGNDAWTKWFDAVGSMAATLGDTGKVQAAGESLLRQQQDRQSILQQRLTRAQQLASRDPRWQTEVDRLAQDLADTNQAIVEQQARLLSDSVSAMERQFSVRSAGLDIRNRMSDLLDRGGDRLGAATQRVATQQDRSQLIRDQLSGYNSLLGQAQAQGNVGVANDLLDKISDLTAQLAESEAATKDLTYTYRSTATAIITGQQDRATGLMGTASTIFGKLDDISGTPDNNRLLGVANQIRDTLSSSAVSIARNVTDAINSTFDDPSADSILSQLRDAFQAGPAQFGTALANLGPAIAALESTMSDTEKQAFDDLISSMIDNTTATLDNSKTITDLTNANQQPQQWSSTAWQWFREAVFNGMGDVMPAYAFPQAETGAFVQRNGLVGVHAGEFIVNPARNNVQMGDSPVNITVNEAGGDVDITHLANRIAFAKKTRK
jgi:hypothetical protein